MSEIIIQKATKEDCRRIMELIKGLAIYENGLEQVTIEYNNFVDSGFGENPVWWAFVAESNGVVYGFSLYYIRYGTWKGQQLYLEDIC